MKFRKYGIPTPHVTESIRPIQLSDEFIYRRLNCLLALLRTAHPELRIPFEQHLERELESMACHRAAESMSPLISTLIAPYPELRERQGLINLCLAALLHHLGLPGEAYQENAIAEVDEEKFQRAGVELEHAYYRVLRELVGREEALRVYRSYMNAFVDFHDGEPSPHRGFATLSSLRLFRIRLAESGFCGRVRIISTIEDGRFIERCENCEKITALGTMEFEDLAVRETILCYSDFPVHRTMNSSFILTRRKTIAAGHAYCDNVVHDIRITKTIEHPDSDFIASLHRRLES